jgi:hypothetical protein
MRKLKKMYGDIDNKAVKNEFEATKSSLYFWTGVWGFICFLILV